MLTLIGHWAMAIFNQQSILPGIVGVVNGRVNYLRSKVVDVGGCNDSCVLVRAWPNTAVAKLLVSKAASRQYWKYMAKLLA